MAPNPDGNGPETDFDEDRVVKASRDEKPSLHNLSDGKFGKPRNVANPLLESLGAPHVGSFNFMLESGLSLAVADLDPHEFSLDDGRRISLWINDCRIDRPSVPAGTVGVVDNRVWPTEARQRGSTYKGHVRIRMTYAVNGVVQTSLEKSLGAVPIMLRSNACHLNGLSPAELIEHGEQETEWGGFFVIGGHERIIRMLQTTRRNYPIAMQRPSWKNRGKNFSDLGIQIDCGKPDLTTVKNVLHFVTTGTAKFMFNVGKELYFVPVVMLMKCLTDRSDAEIYAQLIAGTDESDHYYRGCLKTMLSEPQDEGLFTPDQIKEYIGASFKEKVRMIVPDWYTNKDITNYLIRKSVLMHLNANGKQANEDKFQLIVYMVKKLFCLVQEKCAVEGVDSVMMQEIVLGGHLFLQLLKEKLDTWLLTMRMTILRRSKMPNFELNTTTMHWCLGKTLSLERMFETFISTGNLPTNTGLGLMQDKGMTIMAENINRMRYMSHFRAVHRGSFFQEMRTTEVRALLPDAWGFICPVHTPDGSPCGLLNHMSMPVKVETHPSDPSPIPQLLVDLGMVPVERPDPPQSKVLHVLLNGRVMGYVPVKQSKLFADKLRMIKVRENDNRISKFAEIALIPVRDRGQFPGIFIFTGAARMCRPVWNLAAKAVEYIGTLEQVYMEVALSREEAYPGLTTHLELKKTDFLSNLAQTIPLPDFNQSPRNMYQCQMGKQTMASPTHTWHLNSETKMYRLQTPTSPFFRPVHYDRISMDDYPMGTNAIVAVISYTGYDMEDAMIINKAAYERGFAYGTVYKANFVDLRELATGRKNDNSNRSAETCDFVFARDPAKPDLAKFLDEDGLPFIGTRLTEGDPFYCYRNDAEGGIHLVKKYEAKEVAFVDSVKLCGNDVGTRGKERVSISLRIPRPPSVGDKFASRAGQKGICSKRWITEDLPWTESGLVPDIVFNPHGFPSRMTIAMMVECMAGKSGAVNGYVHDATPFKFGGDGESGKNDAINYFGTQLSKAGYNYYGTETLFSGTDGVEMKADIFFGIIHYQRLRHMVSDKFQVRSQGAVDMVTRQPIKGRRRGGGVRFGEMERDCLLSHGSVFLLQDRLLHGSDKTRIKICTGCGSLLSPRVTIPTTKAGGKSAQAQQTSIFRDHKSSCVVCDTSKHVCDVQVPYIFLHLVSQLAAVNIKVKIGTKHQ